MRFRGRNYTQVRRSGQKVNSLPYSIHNGKKLNLVASFRGGVGGAEEPPVSPTPTPSPSITPTPTITPTPSATPPEQFYILAENSDILQAENGDLLVLEAAP